MRGAQIEVEIVWIAGISWKIDRESEVVLGVACNESRRSKSNDPGDDEHRACPIVLDWSRRIMWGVMFRVHVGMKDVLARTAKTVVKLHFCIIVSVALVQYS